MIIAIEHKGNFKKTEKLIHQILERNYMDSVVKYAEEGVKALSSATPMDTGRTASSWDYEIVMTDGAIRIVWTNSNVNRGVNIAMILQYGHATKNGGYVEGIDYINPALKPIFEEMADHAWKEVVS